MSLFTLDRFSGRSAQTPSYYSIYFLVGTLSTGILWVSGSDIYLVFFCSIIWILSYLVVQLTFELNAIFKPTKAYWVEVLLLAINCLGPALFTCALNFDLVFGNSMYVFIGLVPLIGIQSIYIKIRTRTLKGMMSYEVRIHGRKKESDTIEAGIPPTEKTDIDTPLDLITKRLAGVSGTMKTSLVIMAAIALLGGLASIGTEAISEFSSARQLQIQRTTLVELTKKVKSDNKQVITAFINAHYGDEYEKSLKELQEASSLSWERIAMKATIAILTLFLVQVFFNIYKYNQQQFSYLSSKIETIEMYREANDEKEALRKGLLEKMESPPTFDKDPSAPTEKIINILENVKK